MSSCSHGACSSCGGPANGTAPQASDTAPQASGTDPAGPKSGGHMITVHGIKVQFPVKPYASQKAMMAHIVKGLQRRQNCLLESPTGSGKSLALLCSTLAWQQHEKEKAMRHNDLIDQGITDPDILARAAGLPGAPSAPRSNPLVDDPLPHTPIPPTPDPAAASHAAAFGGGFVPDDDDDFKSQEKQFKIPQNPMDISLNDSRDTLNDTSLMEPPPAQPDRLKIPKIFFGTRTHKQVSQIVKELRRTAYKNVKSVILASREHTCIHPVVSKSRNKNEECRILRDPKTGTGCSFHHGANRIKNHDNLANFGLNEVWDLEDLVRLGKKIKACPYFVSRSLLTTADIVICPYNYLIDPLIRETMDVKLNGHVIVLDEAHNIEDSAREAASCSFTQAEIVEAREDLEKIARDKYKVEDCTALARMLSGFSVWVDQHHNNLSDFVEYGKSGKIFKGTEMIACMVDMGIREDTYRELEKIMETFNSDVDEDENRPFMASATKILLKNVFLMCHFLFSDGMKFAGDYHVGIVREQVTKRPGPNAKGWFSRKVSLDWVMSIKFWCLNPAVAFSFLGNSVRSIVLTSGTLSPMMSFESELGVPFKIKLEANHVINPNQVWVGTVGKGPTNNSLEATYKEASTFTFQDELGHLVVRVCQTVPGGVLFFLPSYSLLDKLLDRWQSGDIWNKINEVKMGITEPRRGNEFEEAMALFYDTIRNARNEPNQTITGAFFMAVYRGKVSEGLDFTDDNARAVIAVGIPFPNFKDIQVSLKRTYNNIHCHSRGLLSGRDWYDIQAYRAVNQALGRCIRHRYDWGALILVDERYQKGNTQNQYTCHLSKWVRNRVVHYKEFNVALQNLSKFTREMTDNPPRRPDVLDVTLDSTNSKDVEVESTVVSTSLKGSLDTGCCSSFSGSTDDEKPLFLIPDATDDVTVLGTVNSSLTTSTPTFSRPHIMSLGSQLILPKVLPFASTQVQSSGSPSPSNEFGKKAREEELMTTEEATSIHEQLAKRRKSFLLSGRNVSNVPGKSLTPLNDSRSISPQLFDSEEDDLNKTWIESVIVTPQANVLPKQKDAENLNTSKGKENTDSDKCNTSRRRSSSLLTCDNDCDLEDFNPVQPTFQAPKRATPHSRSGSKAPAKRKGVHYSDLQ